MTLEPTEGRPALTPVRALRIDEGDEGTERTVTIRIIDDCAAISGSAASYCQLADEIDLFVEHNDITEPGAHTHIGPPLVFDESGLDLVFAGPVPDAAY